MPKKKLLKISQVQIDKETYPRLKPDFITTARYFNALKSGNTTFPPITVAQLGKTYFLVDGMHRLQAHKGMRETHIQVEVLTNLKNKKDIYVEAVKRNVNHGRQFSTQEIVGICINLENWKMSQKAISEIVMIPARDLKPFVAKRTTLITETMEEVPLKAPLQHLAGIEVSEGFDQGSISNRNQVAILNNLIALLENEWLDTTSELINEKITKLYKLMKPFVVAQ